MQRRRFLHLASMAAIMPNLRAFGTAEAATEALAHLRQASQTAKSGGLLISSRGRTLVREGELLNEYYHAMSITKAIAGLGLAKLIEDGKIASLDVPVAEFFPQWRTDKEKTKITLRHVVSHTSGLDVEDYTAVPVYKAHNCVDYALAAPVISKSGEVYFYNNRACNLISGVVAHISGEPMHQYVARTILEPCGIFKWDWQLDPSGIPYTMTGLIIRPDGLMAVASMLAASGRSGNRRVLKKETVASYAKPAGRPGEPPSNGIFWMKASTDGTTVIDADALQRIRNGGLAPETVHWLEQHDGESFFPPQLLVNAMKAGLPESAYKADVLKVVGELVSFKPGVDFATMHGGDAGQYFIFSQDQSFAAVRLIHDIICLEDKLTRSFVNFPDLVGKVLLSPLG